MILIKLIGCDGTTGFEMDLDEDKVRFLKQISKTSRKESTSGCMPIMQVLGSTFDVCGDDDEIALEMGEWLKEPMDEDLPDVENNQVRLYAVDTAKGAWVNVTITINPTDLEKQNGVTIVNVVIKGYGSTNKADRDRGIKTMATLGLLADDNYTFSLKETTVKDASERIATCIKDVLEKW